MKLEETALEKARFLLAHPDVMHSSVQTREIIADLVVEVERSALEAEVAKGVAVGLRKQLAWEQRVAA